MSSSTFITVLSFIAPLTSAAVARAETGDLSFTGGEEVSLMADRSCTGCQYLDGILRCLQCIDASGGIRFEPALHLGNCFGNRLGHIIPQRNNSGNFHLTCDNVSIQWTFGTGISTLYGECGDNAGGTIHNSFPFVNYIDNHDGNLVCVNV
ncbi:hypothetical protein B0T11DRAFT_296093 [Plectosphaerella cucumerina]|uniref:Cyanovirin-N domain-containing protein n=1 Tax=Plectosphaerella cucumerina TaxID=40658 RepID=A0A8K0X7Y7_9PEZI|nr:hypothetical protein B0T11DRAFT_296093 [Plectosphaerella cucumerina]